DRGAQLGVGVGHRARGVDDDDLGRLRGGPGGRRAAPRARLDGHDGVHLAAALGQVLVLVDLDGELRLLAHRGCSVLCGMLSWVRSCGAAGDGCGITTTVMLSRPPASRARRTSIRATASGSAAGSWPGRGTGTVAMPSAPCAGSAPVSAAGP